MICQALKRRGLYVQPCQKCLHCRVNKKSEWVSRLVLESMCHRVSSFVTLTYADEYLPPGGSLEPADLRDFLKRLRSRLAYLGGPRFRFFACGEYGERSSRAHYHVLFFGVGLTKELLTDVWGKGHVDVKPGDYSRMAYVAGYVVKKFNQANRYEGRIKPFIRCSNRPGLGVPAVGALARMITKEHTEFGDVPRSWVHEGKQRPLGRLVRQRLREAAFGDWSGAMRDEAKAQESYWMYQLLHLDQTTVERMLVESEKAAQVGGRVLMEIAGKETL